MLYDIVYPKLVTGPFENKFLDITHEEYHAMRDHVHSGDLIKIIKSPHNFNHHRRNPKPATKPMEFGSKAHEAILEGSKFLSRYVLEPTHSGLTKDGKLTTSLNAISVQLAKAEWHASLPPGTLIVSQEELDKIRWMIDSILDHPVASKLLQKGTPEAKGQWLDPVTGLACVMAIDFLPDDLEVQTEFKTTAECEWEMFRKSVERLRMDVQVDHYATGLYEITKVRPKYKVWIATENTGSHETRVHEVHYTYEESGRIERLRAMSSIKQGIITGKWPQGQTVLEEALPSQWFEKRYVNQE